MSDNEDLLADDLGDHSLADYNIDNDEEEQLLADDYERGESQNVPRSLSPGYAEIEPSSTSYTNQAHEYSQAPPIQQYIPKADCVVPNIIVEVPNQPVVREPLPTYAPYPDEHTLQIPAAPMESPQIVPSEVPPSYPNGDRERFTSERPVGAQRMPQIRDIPDSLDKVVVPRGRGRGSSSWRNPMLRGRPRPYTHYNQRGHFMHRPQFPRPGPPRPVDMQPGSMRPQDRPMIPQDRHMVPQDRPMIHQDRPMVPQDRSMVPQDRHMVPQDRPMMPQDRPMIAQDRPMVPQDRPMIPQDRHMVPQDRPMAPQDRPMPIQDRPMLPQDRPMLPQDRPMPPQDRPMMPQDRFRPPMDRGFNPNFQRFPNFRPSDPRPNFRPNFERPQFFGPLAGPIREVIPGHLPQVTIRQPLANDAKGQEVRMLPVQLPPNLPPGGLQGKKVLINPHFKGNFQPPDGLPLLPTYIPTRIQKSPPRSLSPTLESKFGPIKDIDDAAERFIAEQRNALARAAGRQTRRSPQRYIENTTIEIENDLARPPRTDDDLLRRQEEFINANRAGLRRRMRSPPAVRRSPERRRPRTRSRSPEPHNNDEDSEYRRRVREQETLRERVLRAKELRRRRNADLLRAREREQLDKDKEKDQQQKGKDRLKSPPLPIKVEEKRPLLETPKSPEVVKPDTTRKSPEKETKRVEKSEKEKSPVKRDSEVNSTCESLTPPRPRQEALTPPLPNNNNNTQDDDELELILDDIDNILSDDEQPVETKPAKPKVTQIDLRAKLPPKLSSNESKRERQKIVFEEERERKREKTSPKAKSPSRRTVVTSSKSTSKSDKKRKAELSSSANKSRPRITFDKNKEAETTKQDEIKPKFSNRRVILQRKDKPKRNENPDPSQPNPGIFSRAMRTAIADENRIIIKKTDEPQIEYESESEEEKSEESLMANVSNLPHGMTDTRLKTLAGNDVQSLTLNKEGRTAKITFKSAAAAETFKKKFNNKMVAASRLAVTLQ